MATCPAHVDGVCERTKTIAELKERGDEYFKMIAYLQVQYREDMQVVEDLLEDILMGHGMPQRFMEILGKVKAHQRLAQS